MRTTLTLEDDLARKLKELARRRGISFKEAVNDSIRAGLRQGLKPERRDERFQVEPSHCGFVAGVDVGKINQLADELEAADFVSETKKP